MAEIKFPEEKLAKLKNLESQVEEEILYSRLNLADLKRATKNLVEQKYVIKTAYVKNLAKAVCTPEKMIAYYNSFDDDAKEIFRRLVFSEVVPTAIISDYLRKTGERYVDYYSFRYSPEKIPLGFGLATDQFFTCVLPSIRKALKLILEEILPKTPEITEGEFKSSENFFSGEAGQEFFLHSTEIIQVLMDSNFFEQDVGSSILKTTLNKISKITNFTPFTTKDYILSKLPKKSELTEDCEYKASEITRLENSRMTLALSFLLLTCKETLSKKDGKSKLTVLLSDPNNLYRSLIQNFFSSRNFYFDKSCLYPQIHLNEKYYEERVASFRKEKIGSIFEKIKQNPPYKPENFSEYAGKLIDEGIQPIFPFKELDPYFKYRFAYTTYSGSEFYFDSYKMYLKNQAYYDYFASRPALNNLFLTFASLGLFEITWKVPTEKVESPYDAVDWQNNLNFYRFGKIGEIRMTALGAYVFGLNNQIAVSALKTYAPPQLDKNFLVVHLEDGDKAMQLFLEPFAIPVSKTVYKVDEQKLRKCCKNEDDVKSIFQTLGSKSDSEIPQIWKDLENSVLESFVTLKAETDWIVISLENQSPTIIRCIEKLSRQGFCVKMEGRKIAVKKENYNGFLRRMEIEGFKIAR